MNKTNIDFTWPVTVLHDEDYISLKRCMEENSIDVNQEIIIFGAGIRGSIFVRILIEMGYKNIKVTDNNEEKWFGTVFGCVIMPVNELASLNTNHLVIISVENGERIIDQVTMMGYEIGKNLFFIKSRIYDEFMSEFNNRNDADVVILGDCGFTQISIRDKVRTNLGNMIKDVVSCDLKVLAMHGMGMRSFYQILIAYISEHSVPKALILMLNFEVFTGKHHLLPRTQHVLLFEKIQSAIKNKSQELNEYISIIKKRFDTVALEGFHRQSALNKKNAALVLRMNYMYKLKKDSEDFVYMRKIIEFCKKNNIELIPYIPPVNYSYAIELIGDEFIKRYNNNLSELKSVLNSYGCKAMDLSDRLSPNEFADINTIDETANYQGRIIIRDAFADILRGI